MRELTIENCVDVTEYLNKLHRFRSDLAGVDYKLTDGLYVTALLDGLDNKKWAVFKDKWDTIRAIQLDANPDAAPSIDLLEERLHTEALTKQRREDKKRKQDKAKTKPNVRTDSYSLSIPQKKKKRTSSSAKLVAKTVIPKLTTGNFTPKRYLVLLKTGSRCRTIIRVPPDLLILPITPPRRHGRFCHR